MKKKLNSDSEDGKKKTLKDMLFPEVLETLSSQIQINGNKEAVIEGCKGILEYDENIIRLNLGKISVKFIGDKLSVKSMNIDSLILEGFITGLEFTN